MDQTSKVEDEEIAYDNISLNKLYKPYHNNKALKKQKS